MGRDRDERHCRTYSEQMKEQEFEGVIPPIAEKEKRGKKVKRPKEENYVRELEPKRDGINIPAAN